MSRDFSAYTRMIAVVLIIAVCVVLVPSQADAEPCESERNAMRTAYAAVWLACAGAGLACVGAILDPTRLLIAICIVAGGSCLAASATFITAKNAYDECMQRYNIAGAG